MVRNTTQEGKTLVRGRWCDSVFCRLRGLTFRKQLEEKEGLILVESAESRLGTAIHMMGVFFPLGIVWVNSKNLVVDTRLAKPGGLYFPRNSARYVLEADPIILEHVQNGDYLEFLDAD